MPFVCVPVVILSPSAGGWAVVREREFQVCVTDFFC